jgi:hypothetical protein
MEISKLKARVTVDAAKIEALEKEKQLNAAPKKEPNDVVLL